MNKKQKYALILEQHPVLFHGTDVRNYKSLDFDMTALNINGIIFFFTQREPFCEYQMETRSSFKNETVFFAGYTNGQNAYLASKRGYQVRKGYEYEIEQVHIYTKSPYPLSETMPDVYQSSTTETESFASKYPCTFCPANN